MENGKTVNLLNEKKIFLSISFLTFNCFIAFFILDLIFFRADLIYLKLKFYEKPFEFCLIYLNHVFKDNHYGGLTNWAWFILYKCFISFIGFVYGGLMITVCYYGLRQKNFSFEPTLLFANDHKLITYIYIFFLIFLYDFFIYIISLINFGDTYNCKDIINSVGTHGFVK